MRFSGPGSAPGVLQALIGAAPSAWGTRAVLKSVWHFCV